MEKVMSDLNVGDTVHIVCLGDVPGPNYLDGRTGDGSVGLAPSTDDPYTGTRWRVVDDGTGNLAVRCLGSLDGPRMLDGRTADGSVGLAPAIDGVFTGAHWQLVELDGGTFALRCLGAIDGPRMLDGRTMTGTVGLAPVTDEPYSGTHWRAEPIGLPGYVEFDFGSITFPSGTPVGGFARIALSADGGYRFTGHFHDSGAFDQNVSIAVAVKDSAGIAYGFAHSSHLAGTFGSGSRDDDWDISGTDPAIAAHWADIALGSIAQQQSSTSADTVAVFNDLIGALGTVLGVVQIVAA
jgi:hypothetical protein